MSGIFVIIFPDVIILATAGFDSVPCEMLFQFAREKFPGRVNCFESFASFTEGPGEFTVNTGAIKLSI